MDKELATHIAMIAFKVQAPLEELLPLLKTHCTEEEYKLYLKSIARVMHTINVELTNRSFSAYPEIKTEFEQKIEKYGRII
jgi:hypothetical protein